MVQQIPTYDATALIACTITTDEIPDRIALVDRMRLNLTEIERTPTGLLLHFAPTDDNLADITRFAIDEKRCCEFWGFAITTGTDHHSLRWDGPPATDNLLDQLHQYFTGTEPLAAIGGLL